MKKAFLYVIIIVSELIMLGVISFIFKLETQNSVFGGIGVSVIYGTFALILVSIIKEHKAKLKSIKIPFFGLPLLLMLYLAITIICICLIAMWVLPL